jgi:hypothetical protein
MAEAQHIILTATKWHLGHEVADSDNWWLTLTSDRRAVTDSATVISFVTTMFPGAPQCAASIACKISQHEVITRTWGASRRVGIAPGFFHRRWTWCRHRADRKVRPEAYK